MEVVLFQPGRSCHPHAPHLGASPGLVTESCLSDVVSMMVGMARLLPQAFSDVPGKTEAPRKELN